jgi:hypothetical protein
MSDFERCEPTMAYISSHLGTLRTLLLDGASSAECS